MLKVRLGFIIALMLVSLLALIACDARKSEWEKERERNEAMLAPLAPTDMSVWCHSQEPVKLQMYPYRDLAKQGCFVPQGEWVPDSERGRIHCVAQRQEIGVLCDVPELSESDATERWERFNAAVETYRRAKGLK